MRHVIRSSAIALFALATMGASSPPRPDLSYRIEEGQNINAFVRQGPVAAHLLLRNGNDPRILVAFPAGNSGVGLWFDRVARPVTWRLERAPSPRSVGGLNGVVTTASVDARSLRIKDAVLSNVRYLRDYQAVGRYPAEIRATSVISGDTIRYRRGRLDGAPGYELTLRVLSGRIADGAIVAAADGRIRLEIIALTGDAPLTPLPIGEVLNARAAADPAARNALAFLSYREKFLAGSWRFNTYFGRDTLMSVRLLMPALRPAAIEAGLDSVLARLSPTGEVAHEEGIGEFAILQNRKAGRDGDAAELDYGMIDDDYMLAPVVADYIRTIGTARATTFLANAVRSESEPGKADTVGALLVRNLRFVQQQAAPFAAAPSTRTLIAIKSGRMSGQWRDSDEGLARGRIPYDVNAALVPAALDAADTLLRAGLLDRYMSAEDRAALAQTGTMARIWREAAAPYFRVEMPAGQAARSIRAYSRMSGVPAGPALAAVGNEPVIYNAISLDADGRPVPIVHSDEGFVLLFQKPSPSDLATYVAAIARPFPAGLMTSIGLLTANPVFADAGTQSRFMSNAYHGAGVWSWQQALFAAGLERQLERRDLPVAVRATLKSAQATLWTAIRATRAVQSSELWAWAYRDGGYRVVPFGAGRNDVDESNAAQLWSTVYLAVQPPRGVTKPRRSR